jgi:hypothetical protein
MLWGGLVAVVALAGASASAQTPSIPDTPAGQTLRAWLDAVDSGDHDKIANYSARIDPSLPPVAFASIRGQSGGFDLVSIDQSEPLHLRVKLKPRSAPITVSGNLWVRDGSPPTVRVFGLQAIPPGAPAPDFTVDKALRSKVIEGAGAELKSYYVDAVLAQRMADALKAHERAGDYDAVTDPDLFAVQLQADLRAVSSDGHIRVIWAAFKPPPMGPPSAEDAARMKTQTEAANCNFDRVEILPGNIGYLKFDAFDPPDVCGPTVAAAMGFLAHARALIFDLRENNGGDPAMVAFIASYLFAEPTHLVDIYDRHEETTRQSWTTAFVPGPRLATQPVYVLTSKTTFSGGEEFAYDLQTTRRGTIVGETTGGGAHPTGPHNIEDHFVLMIPFAKSISPITKTNWEGVGVVPDVKVPAADALAEAEKMAASTPSPPAGG